MNILCSGGAGYIGSMLVPRLLHRGWNVTVLDRFPYGLPFLAGCCDNPRFKAIRGDIGHPETLDLVTRNDIIINLAALVGAPVCDQNKVDALQTNQFAPVSIASRLSRNQLMIQPTSDSGYGVGYEANVCTEEHALNPTSLYGRTKVEAEKAVIGSGGISLRLASVFGMSPRMRLDLMVNEFVWRAVHDRSVVLFEGHFRRNFVHVRDVVAAMLHAVDCAEDMRGNAFNCGASSEMMTKRELCEKVARHAPGFEWHESATGFDPDRRDYIVSNEKLEATGWRPKHTLDDGIRELLRGYAMMTKGAFFNG